MFEQGNNAAYEALKLQRFLFSIMTKLSEQARLRRGGAEAELL